MSRLDRWKTQKKKDADAWKEYQAVKAAKQAAYRKENGIPSHKRKKAAVKAKKAVSPRRAHGAAKQLTRSQAALQQQKERASFLSKFKAA